MNTENNLSKKLLKLNGLDVDKISKNDEEKLRRIINRENHKIKLISWVMVTILWFMCIVLTILCLVADKAHFGFNALISLWGISILVFGVVLSWLSIRLVTEKKIFKQIDDLLIKLYKTDATA